MVASRLIFTTVGIQGVSYIFDGTFYYLGITFAVVLMYSFFCFYRLTQADKTILA
jgi:hypothetical protein